MRSVFMAQLAKDRRNPLLIILFITLSIVATVLFAGGIQSPVTIAIFSEEANAEELEAKWDMLLNQEGANIQFKITDATLARDHVKSGQSDVAVKLLAQDYRLITASNLPTIQQVDQVVRKVFTQELQIAALFDSHEAGEIKELVNNYMIDPPFQLKKQAIDSNEMMDFNLGTQLMFAFTLLLAMFTIGFKVNGVTNDKASGIWDRLIVSPIRKTNIYLGHISYSFCITFFQVLVVLLLFKYVLKYDLGHQFGLILLIVAIFAFSVISLAMIITGFISKPEQFYAIYPSIIPIIPLISGAYMPPGMMDHWLLTTIADLFPISHAMDALMNVINHGAGLTDITFSLSIMLLIGVVYMGIGINLVERRGRS